MTAPEHDHDEAEPLALIDELRLREPKPMVALVVVSVVMGVLGTLSSLLQAVTGTPLAALLVAPHLALWWWLGVGAWRRTRLPPQG